MCRIVVLFRHLLGQAGDSPGDKQGARRVKWRSLAAPSAAFQGGGLKAAPPLDLQAINHPPFSIRPGPDRCEAGSGASDERRRSRSVWCWPTAKF